MKRVAPRPSEHPDIARIPQVVRIVIVRIEPEIISVAIEVKQVEVAIGVDFMQSAIWSTTLRILSELYIIWDLKSTNTLHQVSSFFYEVSTYITLFSTLIENILDYMDTSFSGKKS